MVQTQAESTIKLAFGVFRHGIRAPYNFPFPNNPYGDIDKFFPEGVAELTKAGKELMEQVAKIFRLRYGALLGETYSPNNIQFQSTSFDRTIMSTEIMAQTLYPPADYQKWTENQTWHPIPVWTDNGEIDKVQIFIEDKISPRFSQLKLKALESLQTNKMVLDLYEPLSKCTGRTLCEPLHLLYIWDTLFYQDLNGLKLPQWAHEFYPEPLRSINNLLLKTWINYTPETLKLTTGTLFHYIKNILSSKANNTLYPDRKVYLFGGHDTSLVSLLCGIGNEEQLQTAPGATFVFELHEIDQQHIIKVFYLDIINSGEYFKEITLPLGGNPCTLDSFLRATVSCSHEEWKQQC